MNAKEMIKRNNKKKTKFFRKERMKMQVVKDYFIKDKNAPDGKRLVYRVGQIINPHPLMGEQLSIDGIAKEV